LTAHYEQKLQSSESLQLRNDEQQQKIARLSANCDELKLVVLELTAANCTQTEAFTALKASDELNKQKITALIASCDEQKQRISDLTATCAANDQLQQQVSALTESNKEKQLQIASLSSSKDEFSATLGQQLTAVSAEKKQISDSIAQLTQEHYSVLETEKQKHADELEAQRKQHLNTIEILKTRHDFAVRTLSIFFPYK
jgi:chromosome segregation ATPase